MTMSGLALCAAALVILLFAEAVEEDMITTVVERPDSTGSQECRQEIQRQRLSSCRMYLRDGSRQGNDGGWREEFPRCCEELQLIEEQCRCAAIKQVGEAEREEGRLEEREIHEMLKTAQSLPSLCRISPRHPCPNINY